MEELIKDIDKLLDLAEHKEDVVMHHKLLILRVKAYSVKIDQLIKE